ncbi:MAG: M14 family zinc carboxypeptidase [bacterium]
MNKFLHSILIPALFLFALAGIAQVSEFEKAEDNFRTKGEVYFTFRIQFQEQLASLSKIISVDNVSDKQVFAYANRKEFSKFMELGYAFTVLPHPGDLLDEEQLKPKVLGTGPLTIWNFYPTYQQYLDFMNGFAASYPTICKVVFIGNSVQGRQLLAVKISDNVNQSEAEPEFLYTSSMHGNETTGYPTMLHLIDYLLANYGTDPRITDIVNTTEIFINPLANPDGTYWGGNNSVFGAKRYNANYVDLNRNYPDPEDGPHPDGNEWQPETVAFMAFADSNHFVMAANFHGGAEVFNYPWDTWAKLAADDDWWQYVGHEYADTVHAFSPPNYFSGFNNGITNGYQWYTIAGGRQDYMNYWHFCREVTLEISDVGLIPAGELLNHWNYNYRSLLNYIEQVNYGVQGTVTDSVTGAPIVARVYIPLHDIDNSFVYSKLPAGYYSRLLYQGTYSIQFTAAGYFPKTIHNVTVTNWSTTPLDVKLVPLNIGLQEGQGVLTLSVYPNPSHGLVEVQVPDDGSPHAILEYYNMKGERVLMNQYEKISGNTTIQQDLGLLGKGLYLVRVKTETGNYTGRVMIY